MPRRDVLIIGGGIMGAAASLALAQRGLRVTLLDRHGPGHDRGSSHGDSRIFRYTYHQARYVVLAEEARALWRAVERGSGLRLLEPSGNLELGPPGCTALSAISARMIERGKAHERLTAGEIMERFSQIALPRGYEGLYQGDGGVLRADLALAALWRLATAAGADLRPGAAVESIRADGRRAAVILADGTRLAAKHAVLAAGGWNGALAKQLELDLPLRVSREQFGHFPFAKDGPSHRPEALPAIIEHAQPASFYLLPQMAVPGVKCGLHRVGPTVAPDAPRAFDPTTRVAVSRWIQQRFPYVDPTPTREATCLYTNTPDFDFVLDRHPSLRRVMIVGGFSGHGFKFAPRIGELVAELVAEPERPAPEAFRIARFTAAG